MQKRIATYVAHLGIYAVAVAACVAIMSLFRIGCIYRFAGIGECPFCGMTRALYCLCMGDLSGAIKHHPLFWIPPLAWLLFGIEKNWVSVKWWRVITAVEIGLGSVLFLRWFIKVIHG